MNKKLIALAVAGACVAPTVMAQSANPVTLYGRIYATVESVEADNLPQRLRVSDQASYLGVRGTEDLGGGLKAFFQLETGFPVDNASTSFANRNSGVGLQGGWGSILVGRWDTPFKTFQTGFDVWGDLTIADITSANLDQGNFSRRESNNIQYWSPKFSGFEIRANYTANEGKTNTANPEIYGAGVRWTGGAFQVALNYEEHKNLAGSTVTANYKEEGTGIGARWNIGKFSLRGQYGEYKKTGRSKDKSYYVGAQYDMGKHRILGSYSESEGDSASGAADRECDNASIGYMYTWTKRSNFIAGYTSISNDNGGNCNFGTNGLSGASGDLEGFFMGVKHVF